MTAELPEGLHDPVANARVARWRSEVQRLAHSSPPIVGREGKIRELKAAVSILHEYQFEFTSFKWCLSLYGRMAVGLLITGMAMFLLRSAISGRGLPTAGEAVRVGEYSLMSLLAVGACDFLRTCRRLRMAEALADSLVVARMGSSAHTLNQS